MQAGQACDVTVNCPLFIALNCPRWGGKEDSNLK
jgi:hypothetical protein